MLIPSWTYVNVDCKAPTKYNGSYSQRENRWGAREKQRCGVTNTSLKVQGCLSCLPVCPCKNVVGVCCVFCMHLYDAAELPLLKKQGFLETFVHRRWVLSSHHTSKENLHMNVAFCLTCKLLARLGLPFEGCLHAVWSEHLQLMQVDGWFMTWWLFPTLCLDNTT